jgi:hypothetical protein
MHRAISRTLAEAGSVHWSVPRSRGRGKVKGVDEIEAVARWRGQRWYSGDQIRRDATEAVLCLVDDFVALITARGS